MLLNKVQVINFLYLASFTMYGVGKYLMKVGNYSIGNAIGLIPLLCIIIIWLLDIIINKKGVYFLLSGNYLLLLWFSVACMGALFVAYQHGHPGYNAVNIFSISFFVLAWFSTSVIVQFYNIDDPEFSIADILYWGLTLLILVNFIGYSAGLTNAVHAIPGRLNFPFASGFYSTANTVAIINLLIIERWYRGIDNPWMKAFTIVQFLTNLYLMVGFNSRLSIMVFIMIVIIRVTRMVSFYPVLYILSFFTIPIIINLSDLIYKIFQLPLLSSVIRRLSYEDVTGFNGRRDLWERGMEWFLNQGEGFLWGKGVTGHYYIGLLDDLAEFYNKTSALTFHMHSSLLEYLLSIGLVGTLPLLLLFYKCIKRAWSYQLTGHPDAIMLSVIVYLLFLFQVDGYVYFQSLGSFIAFTLFSGLMVRKDLETDAVVKTRPGTSTVKNKRSAGELVHS